MTRAEFMGKIKSQKNNSDRVNKWFLGYLVAFALLFVWLGKGGIDLPENVRSAVFFVSLFGGLLGIMIFFGIKDAKRRRELGLFCPHCKKDLLGISSQIAVASGRCGRCGGVVLDDWNK